MTQIDMNNLRKYINNIENRDLKSFQDINNAGSFLNEFLSFCKRENIIVDFNNGKIKNILNEMCEG